MIAAVRMPRAWCGLVAFAIGAWWVTHDETLKYVCGLLLLAAGLTVLVDAILAGVALPTRIVAVAATGLTVVAIGVVAPILRANQQTSSVWITDVGGTNRHLVDGAILLAPDDFPGDDAPVAIALDPRDGHVVQKIGTYAEGGDRPMFTSTGDIVQSSSGSGRTTVDYYTYPDGRAWSREFASSRLQRVDVIAADDGFAAVRTCGPPDQETEDRECVVEGVDPTGKTAWTSQLNLILNHDRPEDRLVAEVLGVVPGSVDRFRRLDLRDGSVVEEGDDESASELADRYEPRAAGLVLDHALTTADVAGVRISLDDENLTGHRDGRQIWSIHADGAYRATVANGGIALLSGPEGWSPFLPWRTGRATAVSMVRPADGKILQTAVVPYAPLVYPVSDHAAVATGRDDGSSTGDRRGIPGAGEQRLIGRR